jgi:uncharacterized membrane-anchored protein
MKKTGLCLFVVVGLQVLWMLGTAASKEMNLHGDKTVLLETMPVDPRDLLRGDYIILNYKISNVPTPWLFAGGTAANVNGRDIYVTLEKHGQFHEAVAASFAPEKVKAGQIQVRGAGDDSWRSFTGGSIRVRYGIEKYFVKEGTGNPRGKVTVRCVVTNSGELQIKEVFVDGKPFKSVADLQ